MQKLDLRIVGFKTKYVSRKGKMVAEDWVEYCAPGMAGRSTTMAKIADIKRIRDHIDADDIAGMAARSRWEAIQPAYEAWKRGQEHVPTGMPLAAWNGLSPEQIDVLKMSGVYSVEDLATATDSLLGRIPLPGVRDLKLMAGKFLEAQDKTKFADEMARKDAEMALLREQMEEMRQIVLEQAKAKTEDERPRRGRPPKIEADEAVA